MSLEDLPFTQHNTLFQETERREIVKEDAVFAFLVKVLQFR